jgi:hypothetical protein
MLNCCVRASAALLRVASEIANRRWIRVSTEALGSISEGHVFQLLDEADGVSSRLAAEADEPTRPRKDGKVGPPAILVERAPAHQGGAGPPQFNPIADDHIGDRVIQSESIGIDPCARHGEAV